MSFCCSRPLLALLLGAGGLGVLSASALAGDKIEFSRASETLAMPQADHPEDEPANALSALSFLNIAPPQQTVPYQMMLPTAEAPSRRSGDRNSPNSHDGLDSGLGSFGQNGSLENPAWAAYGTNSSSKPAPNDLNAVKAWSSPDNPESLGRGMDRMDSRYGQPAGPLGSQTSSEKRDRLNDFGLGSAGNKDWALRRDEASRLDAKTRISEFLNQQNKSFMDENSGLLKSLSPFAGSKSFGAGLAPSERTSLSPLDRTETGYNANKEPSARPPTLAPGRFSGNQDENNVGGLSATTAWGGEVPGSGTRASQASQAAQSRKMAPSSPSSQGGGQRQPVGKDLPWAKNPNSVFQ